MDFLKRIFGIPRGYRETPCSDFPEYLHNNAPLPPCAVAGCPESGYVSYRKLPSGEKITLLNDRCRQHIGTPLITKLCDHPTCHVGLIGEPFCPTHAKK